MSKVLYIIPSVFQTNSSETLTRVTLTPYLSKRSKIVNNSIIVFRKIHQRKPKNCNVQRLETTHCNDDMVNTYELLKYIKKCQLDVIQIGNFISINSLLACLNNGYLAGFSIKVLSGICNYANLYFTDPAHQKVRSYKKNQVSFSICKLPRIPKRHIIVIADDLSKRDSIIQDVKDDSKKDHSKFLSQYSVLSHQPKDKNKEQFSYNLRNRCT